MVALAQPGMVAFLNGNGCSAFAYYYQPVKIEIVCDTTLFEIIGNGSQVATPNGEERKIMP